MIIFRKLEELQSSQFLSIDNPEKYLSNPVNAFALMKRLSVDWPIISELTQRFDKGT